MYVHVRSVDSSPDSRFELSFESTRRSVDLHYRTECECDSFEFGNDSPYNCPDSVHYVLTLQNLILKRALHVIRSGTATIILN